MNTKKIRDAVELLESVDPLNASRVAERIDEVAAIIRAELDKATKVLTDEEIDRLCLADNSPIVPRDVRYGNRQDAARLALRYARDNGYVAPAAGLTVDEVIECAWNSDYIFTERMEDDFRARLTAAMEAKSAKQ